MHDIRKGTCPACSHNEIVEAPYRVGGNVNFVQAYPDGLNPPGQIMLYACRRCGRFEILVKDCDRVPIGPAHGTRLIVSPEAPAPQP